MEKIKDRLRLLAQELLLYRPGQFERLKAELDDTNWTRQLNKFSAMEVTYASFCGDWYQIDTRLRSMISNWSNSQLAVLPLSTIAKSEAGTTKPIQRTAAQDSAIFIAIKQAGYDPLMLPKNTPGKPGVKAEIRAALEGVNTLFPKNGTVFMKAWDRLRARGELANKA